MTKLGVILWAATLAVMVSEVLRRRTRPLPVYGWLGLAALCIAEALMFRGFEPAATYFTPIAWTAYLLATDAAVYAMRGRSLLRNARWQFLQMALLSIPLWMIFEAYNFRLANWSYSGLPSWIVTRWLGYGWSFATIFPGILVTAELIECFLWWECPATTIRFSRGAQNISMAVGVCFLTLPLVVPRWAASYLFVLVWLGFILLLDPINYRLGIPSLQGDLEAGRRSRLFSLLASGWVCGWLWEFWNFWAAAKWHYIFPIWQDKKIFEMPVPGYFGFLPFALECFLMYELATHLLGWTRAEEVYTKSYTPSKQLAARADATETGHKRAATLAGIALAVAIGTLWPAPARASGLNLPPPVKEGLDLLYSGEPTRALAEFQGIEHAEPDNPLGYILEADAQWWQIYCETCGIRWNMIDAWPQAPRASDDSYLQLTEKITKMAEKHISEKDTAEMELYAGMGWLLRARLLALRNERRATARAGVNARTHFLRCLDLDPQMSDAYLGLGIYNYYVDTLSAMAKVLRVFMGIPGGNKQEGLRQLRTAMEQGELAQVEARFYLAKNLRIFELAYANSLEVMKPLVAAYPQNPIFRLVVGDAEAKLGHNDVAAGIFHEAEQLPASNAACRDRIHAVAEQASAALEEATPTRQ